MKKVSFVVGKDYLDNRIFDLKNPALNRDDCLRPFFLLREKLKTKGYDLQTQDHISPESADLVLYNEMPKPIPANIAKNKSYIVLFESELIRPDNWMLDNHKNFRKIFTWHDPLIDNQKYFKINFPNPIMDITVQDKKREKLVTLISGNKTCGHFLELYSKRLEVIRWFEKNHSEDFDYYGVGWEFSISMWWQKVFRKLKLLKFIPQNPSKCYRGKVKSKNETFKNYQFSICFENGRDIDGYITEKIFDCFNAGNIPVYWGPANIEKHIPRNTFIDMKNFKSNTELYSFLKGMTLEEIRKYQNAISDFLKSKDAYLFSNESFVEILSEEITR